MLTPYRRHLDACPHKAKGQHYTLCNCPIWIYGALASGAPIRQSLRTADWPRALRRADLIYRGEAEHLTSDRGITLSDAIRQFTADQRARKLTRATLSIYGYLFAHLETFLGAGHALTSIDTPELDRFRQSRTRTLSDDTVRPIQASTQRKEIGLLRAFFTWCVDRQWIPRSPARRLRLPRTTGLATLPFEAEDVAKLIAACDRISSDNPAETSYVRHRARALVYALLYSGLRIGDVAQLRRAALNVTTRHLTLRTMKTGAPLKVLLHPDAARYLSTLPATHPDYFFWTGRSDLNTVRKNLARTIDRLGKLAGVKARPHRFRDTFAVELLTNGADIRTVQQLLGHESVRTTEKHYAHFVAAHQAILDTAAAKLNFDEPTGRLVLLKSHR